VTNKVETTVKNAEEFKKALKSIKDLSFLIPYPRKIIIKEAEQEE
jgi:hypothetical protein